MQEFSYICGIYILVLFLHVTLFCFYQNCLTFNTIPVPLLVTEIVGVKYRRTVGILYQMFFSVGLLILPLLAYFITDWRWLQVTFTVPYVLFVCYYW